MKDHKKRLTLVLLAALSVFALAGCSSSSGSESADDTSTSSSTEQTSSSASEDESSWLIGEITVVSDNEITLTCYESDEAVSTVEDIDTDALTATGETETISLADDVSVERYYNGVTQTTTMDALATGVMVAIHESDAQTVYILGAEDDTAVTGTNDSSISTDSTSDSSTSTDSTDSTSTYSSSESTDDSSTYSSSESTSENTTTLE